MCQSMAKRRRSTRKTNSKSQVLPVNGSFDLLTLASETAFLGALTQLEDDFWVQACDLSWSYQNADFGEGPIAVGLANGDLTATEVKEAINASPVSRSDIVARERSRRPIRKVGQISTNTSQATDVTDNVLNDGNPVRTTVKMYLAEGTELNCYAFNLSGAALSTGAILRVFGNLYGRWM